MLNKRIDLQARTSSGITVDLTLAIEDDGLLVNFVVNDKEGNPIENIKREDDPFCIVRALNDTIGTITEVAATMEAKTRSEAH